MIYDHHWFKFIKLYLFYNSPWIDNCVGSKLIYFIIDLKSNHGSFIIFLYLL